MASAIHLVQSSSSRTRLMSGLAAMNLSTKSLGRSASTMRKRTVVFFWATAEKATSSSNATSSTFRRCFIEPSLIQNCSLHYTMAPE